MKIILNIIKYIAIILITCCIIGLVLIHVASSTVLSKHYILGKLEDTKYYEEIKKEIENSFENYIGQSGLEEDVIQDIVSEEQIKKDTQTIISNIYNGKEETINTQQLETNLRNNIDKSLGNQKLTITQQKAIEEYINKIATQYKETMSHTKYESNIHNMMEKVNQMIQKVKKIIIMAVAVCILVVLICNYKMLAEIISNLGIALISSGMFYIFLKMYIVSKIKVSNIIILNDAISNTLKVIINDILANVSNYGWILFASGIVAILVGNVIIHHFILRNKKKIEE